MPIHIQGGGSSKKTGIKSFIGGTRNNESSYDSRAWGNGTYNLGAIYKIKKIYLTGLFFNSIDVVMVDEVSKPANTKLGNYTYPLSLSQVYMVFFGCYNGFSTAAITIEYYM